MILQSIALWLNEDYKKDIKRNKKAILFLFSIPTTLFDTNKKESGVGQGIRTNLSAFS